MRELVLGSGGRRLYNEDLDDLQNNLLAISQIFASENPFVISGIEFTEVSTNVHDVSAGYVWLGGKIRQYGGTTNLDTSTTLPSYIVVSDSQIPRMYDNNTNLPATNVYGTLSSTDITLVAPNDYLRIDDIVNIDRYYENIIGDNYLKLDFSQTQEVKGDVVLLSTARQAKKRGYKLGKLSDKQLGISMMAAKKEHTSLSKKDIKKFILKMR